MNSGDNPIATLVWTFGLMSLFAVGGANAAIPEMHRIAVDMQHWLTDKQFADIYAISQLSPGPNVLIVTLIGYSVAGIAGALAATFGDVRPDRVLAYCVSAFSGAFQPVALARDHPGGPGSAFDRPDGAPAPDCGAGRRPDLGRGPDDSGCGRTRLCHAAQSVSDVAGRGAIGFRWHYPRKIA